MSSDEDAGSGADGRALDIELINTDDLVERLDEHMEYLREWTLTQETYLDLKSQRLDLY